MIDSVLHCYARNLDYAKRAVADLSDNRMTEQPSPGMNHAAWILGHLAWTCDFAGHLLGLPPKLDSSWSERFDNHSHPVADPSAYPPKQALLEALEAGHQRITAAMKAATHEQLAAPLPFEDFRAAYPTVGDGLVHVLTTHEGFHLGQLSAWRRALGLPRV